MNRAGLHAVIRTVTRDGRTFQQTVYVSDKQKKTVQQHKNIDIIDFSRVTSIQQFDNLRNHINDLKDVSEKKIFKHHFMDYLETTLGITWKKDNGPKADDVNWMRALMEAKKHYAGGNPQPQPNTQAQPSQPTTSQQTTQNATGKVVLGTGQAMTKDDAKKAIQDLRAQIGNDAIIALAKANGIKWKENPNHSSNNYMQMAMAMRKHLENGGTIKEGGTGGTSAPAPASTTPQKNAQPKLVVTAKPQPPANTIHADYHTATPKQKLIGLISGILPTDAETENYLEECIKSGRMQTNGINNSGVNKGKYNLPKAYGHTISGFMRNFERWSKTDFKTNVIYEGTPTWSTDDIFKGQPEWSHYLEYKNKMTEFNANYGSGVVRHGVSGMDTTIKTVKAFKTFSGGKGVENLTGVEAISNLKKTISDNVSNKQYLDDLFDAFGVENYITDRGWNDGLPSPMSLYLDMCGVTYSSKSTVYDSMQRNLGGMSSSTMLSNLANGTLTKGEVMLAIHDSIDQSYLQSYVNNDKVFDQNNRLRGVGNDIMNSYLNDVHNGDRSKFNSDEFDSYAKKAMKDFEFFTTDDSHWIATNIALHKEVTRAINNNGLAEMKEYKPMRKQDWDSTTDKREVIEEHLYVMRKAESAREKYYKQKDKGAKATAKPVKKVDVESLIKHFKSGGDGTGVEFPDFDSIRKDIKASLTVVPEGERKAVEAKIQSTHDNVNHRGFKTKVRNVFRIKHLPYEEEFNKIDQARNTTGFYYHGTDYKASQLIIGKSGQFVVTKSNVKAGRMLGDGVYLANNSSKSMQYASNDFSRGNARGVLFLCKASLGNVVTSTIRGSHHNTTLLNQKSTDTVFMDRPYVLNPEWAVKEEKAVIPRLWIDVERVNN